MHRAFMIMPFEDVLSNTVYGLIKEICSSMDVEVRRADEIYGTEPFYDDILNELTNSKICIADISRNNSNVLYELGMSHILKRKYTIIITYGEFDDVPNDIRHFRIISYRNTAKGIIKFRNDFTQTLKVILSDVKYLYEEFNTFIMQVFLNTFVFHNILLEMAALLQYNKPVKVDETLFIEGRLEKGDELVRKVVTMVPYEDLNIFKRLNYIDLIDDRIVLTSLGVAFVQTCVEHGISCYRINDVIIEAGFQPDNDLEQRHEKQPLKSSYLTARKDKDT